MTQNRTVASVRSGSPFRRFLLGGMLIASPFAISSIQLGDERHSTNANGHAGQEQTVNTRAQVAPSSVGASAGLETAGYSALGGATYARQCPCNYRGQPRGDWPGPPQARRRMETWINALSGTTSLLSGDKPLPKNEGSLNDRSHSSFTARIAMGADESDSALQPLFEYETAAMGLVESVALNADGTATVTILGQTFTHPSTEVSVAVGDYAVAASDENGVLAWLVPVDESYVPGASAVWVAGTVAAVESGLGRFSLGNASFDYTAMLVETRCSHPTSGMQWTCMAFNP